MKLNTCRKLFLKSVDDLMQAYRIKRFLPLLESDIVSYLYYSIVKNNCDIARQIHVCCRIDSNDNKKYDLVFGKLLRTDKGKDCIEPKLVTEVKFYARSFSPQQKSKRFTDKDHNIKTDIDKLLVLNANIDKYLLIFEEGNYIKNRLNELKDYSKNKAKLIYINLNPLNNMVYKI